MARSYVFHDKGMSWRFVGGVILAVGQEKADKRLIWLVGFCVISWRLVGFLAFL